MAMLIAAATVAQAADKSIDFVFSRSEPRELKFEVLPYGGARLGDVNDQAQPGAMVEIGPGGAKDLTKEEQLEARLKAMGVRDGESFGESGRWYAFVGGSGKALGFNVRRDPDGPLRSYGLSVDPAAAVGDYQAGVGWRKGDFQASAGYVHRTFKPAYGMENIDFDNKDEMVGISLSLKPQPKKLR